MKFVDEIEIRVRGGHGGPGCVSFLHEKYREHGGPDGGDGGNGGNVHLEAHPSTLTLGHLLTSHIYAAERGEEGKSKNRSGKTGTDLLVRVPPGTVVRIADSDETLGDLFHPGDRLLVAKGGKGGMGNQHFATSVQQTPDFAQGGLPGEELRLLLELKLLADVGLIGLPNAGKSTLLGQLSNSHPKIGDYPFTTLVPNLAILEKGYRRLLVADIPGIIEGASRGAGLGLSFLRHIERVKLIVYVVDATSMDPVSDLKILQSELHSYSPELLNRPALIVLNKMDQANYDTDYQTEIASMLQKEDLWGELNKKKPLFSGISALEGKGIGSLVTHLFNFFPDRTIAEEMLPGS